MLPNLLDDLLKAWDSKAGADPVAEAPAEPPPSPSAAVVEASADGTLDVANTISILPTPELDAEPLLQDLDAGPAPATPMDDLLSSLLASFEEIPVAEAAPAEPPPPQPAPIPEPPPSPDAEQTVVEDAPLPPPPPVRERETLAPIAAPQPAPAATKKFVAVSFGRHKLAFPIDSVVEAGRYPQTTFVPGLPPHIRGVFAFRGSVLPVVDTRLLTGAPERFLPHECRVLTLQSGTVKAAFVFDTLEGIVNLDPGCAAPVQDEKDAAMPLGNVLTGIHAEDGSGHRFGVADATRLLDLAGCLKDLA